MSNRSNSRGPKDKNNSFDQNVDWAKKKINADREKHTWDSKFWYVVCGIIVLIIILGLLYVFYWRKKSNPLPIENESILETINQQANSISPVSALTPRTPTSQDSSPPVNRGNRQFVTPNYGRAPVMSPGGSYLPAVTSSGKQNGWWFYPPRT
uniref:Transmembrane protein n=1 Tax=Pithovirus LCPAC202 TaxID=2506592 RepID=A0A481Z7X8_9VIRU|nr:MAG: hypothetical protein LCPAC202_02040 [Pithovirus LCPAC202]